VAVLIVVAVFVKSEVGIVVPVLIVVTSVVAIEIE
jgi:hypothetical protein